MDFLNEYSVAAGIISFVGLAWNANWGANFLELSLVMATQIVLFIPIFLIWAIYAFDLGKSMGVRHFISEFEHHYERQMVSTEGREKRLEGVFWYFVRLTKESPSLWTHLWLGMYIVCAWGVASRVVQSTNEDCGENCDRAEVLQEGLEYTEIAAGSMLMAALSLAAFMYYLVQTHWTEKRGFWTKAGEAVRVMIGLFLGLSIAITALQLGYFHAVETYITEKYTNAQGIGGKLLFCLMIYCAVWLILICAITIFNFIRPIAAPYLFFAFFVFLGIYAAFALMPYEIPILTAFACALYIVLIGFIRLKVRKKKFTFDGIKARVPGMDGEFDMYKLAEEKPDQMIKVAQDASTPNPELLDIMVALENWHKQASKAQGTNRPKMILMGTSGGAALAGYWTAMVADALVGNDKITGGMQAIKLITGASGGMVGASYVAGMAPEINAAMTNGFTPKSITQQMDDDSQVTRARWRAKPIKRDLLSQVFAQLINSDLMGVLLPWFPSSRDADRGKTLDRQFRNFGLFENPDDPSPTFSDFRKAEEDGTRPSLLFSPMLVETGVPLLISNLNFKKVVDEKRGNTIDNVAMFDLFKGSEKHFSVATAARMSATFPYVSPAVPLPMPPDVSRRVVDAGYYENYGLNLICQFLMTPLIKEWIAEFTGGVAVLQLRAFPRNQKKKSGFWGRCFQFMTGPIEGLLAARGSSQLLRNAQMLRRAQRAYDQPYWDEHGATLSDEELAEKVTDRLDKNHGFIRSFVFTNVDAELPLNWFLPPFAYANLSAQLRNPNDDLELNDDQDNYDQDELYNHLNACSQKQDTKLGYEVMETLGYQWNTPWHEEPKKKTKPRKPKK